jgi:hypothetical protein
VTIHKRIPKIVWYFLAAGAFVPCMLQALFFLKMVPIESMPEWLFFTLWPAFGFVMASDTGNGPDAGEAAFGFFLSVFANALAYGLLGGIFSFFWSRLRRMQPHCTPPGNSD